MNEIKRQSELSKEAAELSKKIDAEKANNKTLRGFLESDIRFNRDTTINASDVKRSSERLARLERERERTLSKLK